MPNCAVCVIEDNDDLRNLLCTVLRRSGFQVTGARDGNEGIKSVEKSGAQVVVTDIVMPNREGIETIIELKARMPDIRILAISGGGQTQNGRDYLELASHLGADDALLKPFSLVEFLHRITKLARPAAKQAQHTAHSLGD
jgi:DNA-binding response OmpR family regulator